MSDGQDRTEKATPKRMKELRRKGYQLAREEKQVDGTLKQVWQRWR